MKCLSASKSAVFSKGHVLHDWHAEVVAIRAFNHFLLQEAHDIAICSDYKSTILRRQTSVEISQETGLHAFTIHEDLRIMMYCSEAPCGDASMELVMEAQEDPTPWPVAARDDHLKPSLLGRGSFSQLGVVRRKPGKQAHASSTRTIIEQESPS